MFLSNTLEVQGKKIDKSLGLVMGNTIRAKNVFQDVGASLKSLVGGEIKDYTHMIAEARTEAIERMVKEAENLGANAIVNIRFTTASLMGGAAEILAYGTAVKTS